MRPDVFQINLEKTVYFPGEIVRGNLLIQNRQDLKCKGIRVTLQGKGHSRFTTGSGDNKEVHDHTQMYASHKKTVWGNVMKTPVLNDAGANAIFGPPWAPDEGALYISVSEQQNFLIVRVMDYDWCKKDDLLGEIHLDIRSHIERGDVVSNVQLHRNGKPESGMLAFSMNWEHVHVVVDPHNPHTRTLRLQIHSATSLRAADWFGGRNDVYVQAYALPANSDVNPHKALPLPNDSLVLPPCNMQMPFLFQLPDDLPSTYIHNQQNYIVYSIYANIDIQWKLDVTHRLFFTVIQPNAVASMMYPLYKSISNEIYPQCCIPPCCCCNIPLTCCGAYGNIKVNAYLERAAYAPGEIMPIVVKVDTTWPEAWKNMTVTAQLLRHTTLYAEGHYAHSTDAVANHIIIKNVNEVTPYSCPPCAPTYLGGLGQDLNWYGQVSRYGGRWAARHPDPIIWKYTLQIIVQLKVPGCAMNPMSKDIHLPIVISGMGLNVLPAIHAQNMGATARNFMVQNGVLVEVPGVLQQQVPQHQSYQAYQQQHQFGSTSQYSQLPQQIPGYGQYAPVPQQNYGNTSAYPQQTQVQNQYPTVSQEMVRSPAVNPEPSSYVQSIVFPSNESSDGQAIPDWKSMPEIKDSLGKLSKCPLVPYTGQPVLIRDLQEDYDVKDQSVLQYQPMYYSSPPNLIRD